MSISLTESEFVDNLLSLASIHPFKLNDDYTKPQSQLVNLGPPLPPFKYSYKKSKAANDSTTKSSLQSSSSKTVVVKSIKPKTILKLNSADYNTVEDLKNFLLNEALPGYFEFKLLNKGKVLLDYVSLADIVAGTDDDELVLNLMCKVKPAEAEKPQQAVQDEDLFVESQQIVIPWEEFQTILEKKYGASEGLKALKKLQLGWEQTK